MMQTLCHTTTKYNLFKENFLSKKDLIEDHRLNAVTPIPEYLLHKL